MHFSTKRRYTLLRWTLCALFGLVAAAAHAQTSLPATYDFVARAVPLSTAIERLVSQTKIDLYYDPPLVAGKRTSCVMQKASSEDLLRCILKDTGLDFIRLSSGLYVVTRATETAPLYGKVRGIVVDAETGQPLPHAHVILSEASTGTTSNEAGLFAFAQLKPGSYQIIASYIGYRSGSARVEVPPGGDTQAQVALQSEPMLVAPIVIDGLQWRLPSADLGKTVRDPDALPPGRGANDVLVGLNTLLGVRVNDATADIHIQGGETGEHQLRLDGAPVFLPLSFASFVGPFSPFAVGAITVHKAGFNASEGSLTSGAIDIQHTLAAPIAEQLDVQIDPLSLNARAQLRRGSTDGVQASLMASGRMSLWRYYQPPTLQALVERWNEPDPFLKAAFDRPKGQNTSFDVPPSAGNPGLGFNDIHLASRVRFGLLRSLYTSAYWGESRLGSDRATESLARVGTVDYRDRYTWRTGVLQTRYESFVGARTLASIGVRGSYYRLGHSYNVPDSVATPTADGFASLDPLSPDDGNRVYEVALVSRLDHALGDRQNVHGGLELIRTGSRFIVLGTQAFPIQHHSAGWRVAAYAEDEINLTSYLTVELGGRLTYLHSHRALYAEPRSALRLDVPASRIGPWSLRLSGGRYRQFVNQFDVSSRSPGALIPATRFWLLADSTIRPPLASHYAAEWLWKPSSAWSMRLEGYHKQHDHALAINYAPAAGDATRELQQSDFVKASQGTVSGAGVQLQRHLGVGRLEARYEYSVARRVIPGFFGGRVRRAPWDEPHGLEFALDLSPLRDLTVLARWRGVWGRSWGFRKSYYDFLGAFERLQDADLAFLRKIENQIDFHTLKDPDSHTLPPIYQLDLGLAYARRVGPVVLQGRLDALNVLNRNNVAEWHLVFDEDAFYEGPNSGFLTRADRPLLPRYVSVALKASW